MNVLKRCLQHQRSLLLAAALTCSVHGAQATTIQQFSGTFSKDDDIAWTDFSVSAGTLFSARSFSFGLGGFAPVLTLFSADGGLELIDSVLGSNNSCATPGAGQPSNGLCWDAFFSRHLAAGNYRLVVSQDGNLASGASFLDGYLKTGNPNYTGIDYAQDPSRSFINVDGSQRTASYDIQIQGGNPIPEPAPVALLAIGLVAFAASQRRSKNSSLHS